MMKNIIKIVITGGVCSGKTTSLSYIEKHLRDRKYGVVIVPETASVLINQGLDSRNSDSMLAFQESVLSAQLKSEECAVLQAENMPEKNVVMILDRGSADAFGYLTENEAEQLMKKYSLSQSALLARYDAVIHLVTAANGAEEFYTLKNNNARIESPEEARRQDLCIQNAWAKHKNHFVIGNDGNFDLKMKVLLRTIDAIIVS